MAIFWTIESKYFKLLYCEWLPRICSSFRAQKHRPKRTTGWQTERKHYIRDSSRGSDDSSCTEAFSMTTAGRKHFGFTCYNHFRIQSPSPYPGMVWVIAGELHPGQGAFMSPYSHKLCSTFWSPTTAKLIGRENMLRRGVFKEGFLFLKWSSALLLL